MPRLIRRCVVCGAPTRGGGRCAEHPRAAETLGRTVYHSARWRHLQARVLREHRDRYGPVCPGWGVAAHPSADLTADHRIPLSKGGAPFDRRNVGVLCRDCNGRKRDE